MSTMAGETGDFLAFGTTSAEAPWARRVGGHGPRGATGSDHERRRQRLVWLASLMDSSITVPGTNFRFGLDPLLGLAPGIGDIVSNALSLYIVYEGWKLGASRKQLAMMIGNVVVDTLIGAVPVLGDVFDFAFKANVRNLAILGIRVPARPGSTGAAARSDGRQRA